LLLAFGLAGGLSLHDAQHWLALTDAVTGLVMLALLRKLAADAISTRLVAGYLPTTALFTFILGATAPWILELTLAAALAFAGGWLALRRGVFGSMPPERAARWALPVGMVAGVLGGLFGMGGPIIFLLLAPASRDPAEFRARAVFIFAPANLMRFGILAAAGGYGADMLALAAWSAPVVIASIALGMWLHRKVRPAPFRMGLGLIVAAAGLVALVKLGADRAF
jgi:uncharacterized membrane protein YfcA